MPLASCSFYKSMSGLAEFICRSNAVVLYCIFLATDQADEAIGEGVGDAEIHCDGRQEILFKSVLTLAIDECRLRTLKDLNDSSPYLPGLNGAGQV
jgi:hypothetical protein